MGKNKMKKDFRKFVLSLYKPVKCLTFIMIGSMIISQILDLIKQYIIKGIIDLPNMENFQTTDLYKTIFILLFVIVLDSLFLKKGFSQTPYISEKLFNNLDKKHIPFLQIIILVKYLQLSTK